MAARRRVRAGGAARPKGKARAKPTREPPIVAVSGRSGAGKTRLLARLIPALAARGVRVGLLKHTSHDHPFDRPGKDTEVLRRAGAVAAVIQGPRAMALFGPPRAGARALARLLPPCDLVLAEGWRGAPLPRLEVHRRAVAREWLCATDGRVFAVVTDESPPRPLPVYGADEVEAVAELLVQRFLGKRSRSGSKSGSRSTAASPSRPASTR